MWPYPSPSQARIASRRVSLAISRASRRVRFIRAPVWMVIRSAPIHPAAWQEARI